MKRESKPFSWVGKSGRQDWNHSRNWVDGKIPTGKDHAIIHVNKGETLELYNMPKVVETMSAKGKGTILFT